MPRTPGHPARARPDEADLHEAALRHLARYACSVAGLVRVLDRRVDRWARDAGPDPAELREARAAVRRVAARLQAAGAVDDASFAQGRARSLARAGRSTRAITAHLLARGIDAGLAREAMPPDPDRDLAAALLLARRRLGPFRAPADAGAALGARGLGRELAALARAGFAEPVARRVLGMERAEAEALLAPRRDAGG